MMELRLSQDIARRNPVESDIFGCLLSLLFAGEKPLQFSQVIHRIVPLHDTCRRPSEPISLDNYNVIADSVVWSEKSDLAATTASKLGAKGVGPALKTPQLGKLFCVPPHIDGTSSRSGR